MSDKETSIEGDFQGQLAHGNIINNIQDKARKLHDAEKFKIRKKVSNLEKITGKELVEIRSEMKCILGLGQDELCLEHEKAAHAILDLMLENATLKQAPKTHHDSLQAKLDESAGALTQLTRRSGEQSAEIAALTDALKREKYQRANVSPSKNEQALQQGLTQTQASLKRQQELTGNYALRAETAEGKNKQAQFDCDKAKKTKNRAILGMVLTLAAAIATGTWFYLQTQSFKQQLAAISVPSSQLCHFQGQPYSPGSSIAPPGKGIKRCELANNQARWVDAPALKSTRYPAKKIYRVPVEEKVNDEG
jgi:hypothetical protein